MKRPGATGDSKSFRAPAESERSYNHFTVLFWFSRCLAETVTKRGWFAVFTLLWHSNYFYFFSLTRPFHSMTKAIILFFLLSIWPSYFNIWSGICEHFPPQWDVTARAMNYNGLNWDAECQMMLLSLANKITGCSFLDIWMWQEDLLQTLTCPPV